jgi:hypothetical protein
VAKQLFVLMGQAHIFAALAIASKFPTGTMHQKIIII